MQRHSPDILHIFNGQSTLNLFNETNLIGDQCIWDEILSDGPVQYQIATESFWQERAEFISQAFSCDPERYDTVKNWFEKIRNFRRYKEITLWYEYDLFCQINLMALLSWFYHEHDGQQPKISLICVGNEEGYDRLVGLGQLPSRRFPSLYEARTTLSEANLEYADRVWEAYCNDDPNELQFTLVPHPIFIYLSQAIDAHLNRFSNEETGFNEIEWEILRYVDQNMVRNADDIVRHLLQWQRNYGFGDLQYFIYLNKMEAFLSFGEGIFLSPLGKDAIQSKIDRLAFPVLKLPLGGSNAHSYHWKDDLLIPIK